jgi:hypothetical protein
MVSFLRDGSVSLWVSLCRIQCEKQNRDWHDCEVDDETAYRDRNGAEPSEQIAEDGWTYERHCWRGSRQRGQRAGAHLHAENDTGEQKHRTVEANDGDAQGDDQRDVLTECRSRRRNGSGKKRQRHGVKQHHPIQRRGILQLKTVVPCRYEAEQEGDDHRKECAQYGV